MLSRYPEWLNRGALWSSVFCATEVTGSKSWSPSPNKNHFKKGNSKLNVSEKKNALSWKRSTRCSTNATTLRRKSFGSPHYIQHSAHIHLDVKGLFNLIKSLPPTLKYDRGERGGGRLRDRPWTIFGGSADELDCTDILRIKDGFFSSTGRIQTKQKKAEFQGVVCPCSARSSRNRSSALTTKVDSFARCRERLAVTGPTHPMTAEQDHMTKVGRHPR